MAKTSMFRSPNDAEIPGNWLARTALEGTLSKVTCPSRKKVNEAARTHWGQLLGATPVLDELDEMLRAFST